MRPLLLASTSPRRRELLQAAGIEYALVPPGHEPAGSGSPSERAQLRATMKARGAAVPFDVAEPLVLGVDTVVALGEREFGKPTDRAHAARMLRELCGTVHEVITAHCLFDPVAGRWAERAAVATVRGQVLSAAELDAYLDTEDWADKAGGYGIQSVAGSFMQLVSGELDTVIGLNVASVRALLKELR